VAATVRNVPKKFSGKEVVSKQRLTAAKLKEVLAFALSCKVKMSC
jgi:stress-induced morphogen